ncbi:2-hydroxyacid dehydrogenase [Polycladidibacter stylochi]|uniref:2-hydroxyacid dehydrogenase n=1 Tax=Polycladidibacter stylochi TaxID=1807766 RepID=UPI00082DC04C|nr:2-hydroxyacid dehydrogenase [Pseudovibrio stylochi]
MEVLQLSAYAPEYINELFQQKFQLHRWWELVETKPEAEVLSSLENVEAVATKGTLGLSAQFMQHLPNLKIISIYGVGYDKIDLAMAKQRGIKVTTTPVLTDAVAEQALALALAASRRIAEGDRFVRSGEWLQKKLPIGFSVAQKTVGIVGFGRIGQKIAQLFQSLGCEILYNDLSEKPGFEKQYCPELIELAKKSRILVLAAAGGDATKSLISKQVLAALGPDGLLVNVARGSLIDEKALQDALQNNIIGHAALDVYWQEPEVPHWLSAASNATLVPHMASATYETRQKMADMTLGNLLAYQAGEPLQGELDLQSLS